MTNRPAVRVALLGCGTVGAEVVRLLHHQSADLTARIGAPLEIVGIAVRRLGRERGSRCSGPCGSPCTETGSPASPAS